MGKRSVTTCTRLRDRTARHWKPRRIVGARARDTRLSKVLTEAGGSFNSVHLHICAIATYPRESMSMSGYRRVYTICTNMYRTPSFVTIHHRARPWPSPVHLYKDNTSRRRSCCSPKSSTERPRTCMSADRITFRKLRCQPLVFALSREKDSRDLPDTQY